MPIIKIYSKQIILKEIIILLFFLFLCINSFAQIDKCNLIKSKFNDIYHVNKNDIICLSKNTLKNHTLIYTFGIWCAPCRLHLPNALKLSKNYNIELYVLLIDKESDKTIVNSINYLKNIDPEIKIIILKDDYGNKKNIKYKRFLNEITPNKFENINDMSKYIIIDKNGNIIMITNWKDNKENNWKDDSLMIKNKIIPLLK